MDAFEQKRIPDRFVDPGCTAGWVLEEHYERRVSTSQEGEIRVRSTRLLAGADILLMDEPTNHLDLQAVAWLKL